MENNSKQSETKLAKLSVVTTLYQSANHIEEFLDRIIKTIAKLDIDQYEIIVVNDCSPDAAYEVVYTYAEKNQHICLVDLSRNFGHHKALMTGLEIATGELIFLIDSDLEEAPESLLDFYQTLQTEACDVVYGVQSKRKGGLFEKVSGFLYFKALNYLTKLKLPQNLVTARLMTQRYVKSLLMHTEREFFIAGLWELTGYVQKPLTLHKESTSPSTYTLRSKLSLLVNSVVSFSNRPLVFIFYVGAILSLLSALFIMYVVINWMFFARPVGGWTSLIASVWLLGGLIISFIGIVGIYISKIFTETKQRPNVIIRDVNDFRK